MIKNGNEVYRADCSCSYCSEVRNPQLAKWEDKRRKKVTAKRFLINQHGGKCIDCGYKSKHDCAFDFHHRDPATKEFALSTRLNKYSSDISQEVLDEVAKCDLICSNCHRIRHSGEGAKPRR